MNDYFKRPANPGRISIAPPNLIEHSHLWNGRFETRFAVPWNALPGDLINISVTVEDIERDALGMPFVSTFTLKAEPEAEEPRPHSGGLTRPHGARPNGTGNRIALALPNIREISKSEWQPYDFDQYRAVLMRHDGQGGYDCFVNIDNISLLTELARAREEDKPLVKFWFSFGLVLAALSMIRHRKRLEEKAEETALDRLSYADGEDQVDLDEISRACDGLAQVIVPIIRSLYRGPVMAPS
jgi:hypothetical protein